MANARGKQIDNTHLSISLALERGFLHADYVAHACRWSLIANRMVKGHTYKSAKILDVGCGVDIPLAKLLYSSRLIVESYVGLDWNNPDKLNLKPFHTGKFPIRAFGGVDFSDDSDVILDPAELKISVLGNDVVVPNIIVCLEVLEHVEPDHAVRMLRKMALILKMSGDGSVAYVSTPCYDAHVGAAANHVNEIKRQAFGSVLESVGFEISENFGTFGSQRDYREELFKRYPGVDKLWADLKPYYVSGLLGNLFCPVVPEFSRNNIWVLKSAKANYERKFPLLSEIPEPWSSSEKWQELISAEK